MAEPEQLKQAVTAILHFGLVAIRNNAEHNPAYAFVEADHLHNLPTYLGKPSDDLLRSYYDAERICYQDAVSRLDGDMGHIARTFYVEPWKVIEEHLTRAANNGIQPTN